MNLAGVMVQYTVRGIIVFDMVSGLTTRCLAALFGICFASMNLLPSFESPCPVHDPALARLAATDQGTAASHSASAMHLAMHHQKGQTHSQSEKSHRCSCIGCSVCPTTFNLVENRLTFAPARIIVGTKAPLAPETKIYPQRADHSLPFPTAPPTA